MKKKKVPIPPKRIETIRKDITSLLEAEPLIAKDLSALVGVREKEVYEHLEHIRISLYKKGKGEKTLKVTPAECRKCGFVFKKRERLKKPGKCPKCKGESIEEPVFSIV